jgi:hypothetical protein
MAFNFLKRDITEDVFRMNLYALYPVTDNDRLFNWPVQRPGHSQVCCMYCTYSILDICTVHNDEYIGIFYL